MAPITHVEDGPSNLAQMGFAWNVLTGTVDLGIALYDAIIVAEQWLNEYLTHRAIALHHKTLARQKKPVHESSSHDPALPSSK
jgi:hypothetical protein